MKETILYQNGKPIAIASSCDVRENNKQYWKIPQRGEVARLRSAGLREAINPKKVIFQDEFWNLN